MNIMRNVVNGMLKDKTRILVTHSIDFLHMADRIIMMDKGKITAQGTYDELMSNETFSKLQEINNLNKDDCKNTEIINEDGAKSEEEKTEAVTEDNTDP
jgi:ABC-type multidrug transport system ATPase subunit